jgi:putative PIN family toxin of toxin-antitoxin system
MKLVFDTNIVLDWLVFDDPALTLLSRQLQENRITLLTDAMAIQELQRVLNYPALGLNPQQQTEVLSTYQQQTLQPALPMGYSALQLQLPPAFPICSDADDQPFLALAFHSQADALVSRDQALLRLKKPAAKHGVSIIDIDQLTHLLSQSLIN